MTATLLLVGVSAVAATATEDASEVLDDCATTGRLGYHCGTWKAEFDEGLGLDRIFASETGPGGNTVFAAGQAEASVSSSSYVVAAYDAETGEERWRVLYGDGPTYDIAFDIAVGPDGDRVYVTGALDRDRFGTLAFEASDGTLAWTAEHDPRPGINDSPGAVEVSRDGETVFVTGQTIHFQPPWEIHVVAYGADDGQERWVHVFDSPEEGRDLGSGLAVSPDGERVFLTGESEGAGDEGQRILALALDARTGEREWVHRLEGEGAEGASPRLSDLIGVSPDGNTVFVAGNGVDSEHWYDVGVRLVALDAASGEPRWHAQYDNGDADAPLALAVSPDGERVFVAGGSNGETRTEVSSPLLQDELDPLTLYGSTGLDAVTIAYDAETGEELWTQRYQDPTHGSERFNGDKMNALAVSPDGTTVFATGQSHYRSTAATSSDAVTIAYDASSGDERWVAAYSSPQGTFDGAWDIALGPGGDSVFAAGWADGGAEDSNALLLAYDAQGPTPLSPSALG